MRISFKIPVELNRKALYVWLASWFGCGFLRPAPGTWGSLGALPFGILIYILFGAYGLLISAVIVTFIGLWASEKFDKALGQHDSKMIVIDEVAGQWIALIPAGLNPVFIIISFICFRFFDITKPWPVSHFDENVKGPVGVMGDDIIAGIFAAICVYVIQLLV